MKQKKLRTGLLLTVVALLALGLWYTAPRTAEDLFPDFAWEEVIGVAGAYDRYEANDIPAQAPVWIRGIAESVPIESEEGQAILALLKDVKYRRSLWNLIPSNGTRSHIIQPDDLSIYARFYMEDAPAYLTVEFYYDSLRVFTSEQRYDCSVKGQDELARQLYALYLPYASEEVVD